MNTMKNLLYLFIFSTILISCSSDNDLDIDPIIGKWQLQSVLENGEEETTECERKTTISFSSNGTTNSESFDSDGGNCESQSDTSTWKNIGNSTYRIARDDEDAKLSFSQNNTVFSASLTETDNGDIYTIVITYRKI